MYLFSVILPLVMFKISHVRVVLGKYVVKMFSLLSLYLFSCILIYIIIHDNIEDAGLDVMYEYTGKIISIIIGYHNPKEIGLKLITSSFILSL